MAQVKSREDIEDKIIADMAEAGVLYSHKKSKADPRMKPFIAANRYELDMLDAGAVLDSIKKATSFLEDVLAKNGTVLFVGTTSPAKALVENAAKDLGQPYVVTRWLGGTITNFDVIRDRIDYYLDLQRKEEEGELEKYTKKEQVEFSKEIDKLSKNFDGLVKLENRPRALFVVDIKEHSIAVNEADKKGIPVVAVVDSNDNPEAVDYPIIANDHTRSSIEWVFNWILDRLKKTRLENESSENDGADDENDDKEAEKKENNKEAENKDSDNNN